MKTTLLILLAIVLSQTCRAEDFLRNLPDAKFSAQLTPEKFSNSDAVIILKEQSLNINAADISWRGVDFRGMTMTRTTILLAKVFNASGIRRFGSFEYEYAERFGDEIRAGFACRARVQKPDGAVVTMPGSDVRMIVSEENSDGEPLARKAVFKVPDLAPGDVVQIEYTLTEPLARALSGLFYYNDRVPVLYSNLSITLPADDEIRVYSFPEDRVGQPRISQVSKSYGAGQTYFWNLKNLNKIPKEAYTYTFDDMSLMTAFVVNPRAENGFRRLTDWNFIAGEYSADYIDAGSVRGKRVVELGFQEDRPPLSMSLADSLYKALRQSIALKPRNSLYPLTGDIDDVFTKKRGDASDLAYIFYKILHDWKADARVAWIRDKREGTYESSVPSVWWFDRIGVLVKVGNEEKMYDFDRSVPAHYQTPSYLKSVTVPLLGGKACEQRTLPATPGGTSCIREAHDLTFTEKQEMEDSLVYSCTGTPAEEYRHDVYDLRGTELQEHLKTLATERCLATVSTLVHSPLLDDPEIRLTYNGRSKGIVAAVDGFLTVKLPNEALRGFREEIFSVVRNNDVVLIDPLTVTVSWRLHVPRSYTVHSLPPDTTIPGPKGMSATLRCSRTGDGLLMEAGLKFTEGVIPAGNFPHLVGTLDGLLSGCEQAIVLAKK